MKKAPWAILAVFLFLALGAVTSTMVIGTGSLLDNAVTNAKMADNAIGNAEMADDAIAAAELGAYFTEENAEGSTGTALTVDWTANTRATATISGNVEFYFTDPVISTTVKLYMTNDGLGGAYTRAFPPSPEVTTITTVADVSDSLDGTYFLIYDSDETICVWIDVDDSGTVQPGGTCTSADRAIEITTIVTDDTANTVATRVQTTVNADASYTCTVATNVVTCTDAADGDRTNAADNDTGFTIATTFQGDSTSVVFDSGTAPTWATADNAVNYLACDFFDTTDVYVCSGAVGLAAP